MFDLIIYFDLLVASSITKSFHHIYEQILQYFPIYLLNFEYFFV